MPKYSKVVLCMCIFSGGLFLVWMCDLEDSSFKNHKWTQGVTKHDRFISPYFTVDGPASIPRWTYATSNVYVFSAYLDSRQGANETVNIIGVLRQKPQLRVKCFCLLEDHAAYEIAFTPARILVVTEHHDTKYAAASFVCPYTGHPERGLPQWVRLAVAGEENALSEKIRIHVRPGSNRSEDDPAQTLALCVRPFFRGVPKLHDLVHFIAYYTIQGVYRFTFYSHQSSAKVNAYLKNLSRTLPVDLLPWNLPVTSETWKLGHLAFIQDCLYRHMNASRYVLTVDLDEFVYPFPKHGIRRRITDLISLFPKNKTCFSFRNMVYVRKASRPSRPFIFEGLMRSVNAWPPNKRSKYAARLDNIVEGSTYTCSKVIGASTESSTMVVDDALMFHYRYLAAQHLYDPIMLTWKNVFFKSPVMSNYLSHKKYDNIFDLT